jgi:hypothetical protein
MKILLKCRGFEQITKMQAEQQKLPDSITTKGVPEMLTVAGDVVGPVYKFLRGWL